VVETAALGTVDRLGLQSDAFALAKAGLLPTEQALALVEAYRNETDFTIWSDIAINLGTVTSVWAADASAPKLKTFVRNFFSPIAEQLGWEKKIGEEDNTSMLRSVVLTKAGSAGHEGIIAEAKKRFSAYLLDTKSLSADLRFVVYKLLIENGGVEEYESILKIYRDSELHEEKLRALRALGFTPHADLIERTLKLALSSEVRSQDVFYVISSTASSVSGRQATWNYLRANWAEFEKLFGEGGFLLPRIISMTVSDFTSDEKADEVEAFFKEHPLESAARTIKQSLETIRAQAKWLNRDKEGVAKWLSLKD